LETVVTRVRMAASQCSNT